MPLRLAESFLSEGEWRWASYGIPDNAIESVVFSLLSGYEADVRKERETLAAMASETPEARRERWRRTYTHTGTGNEVEQQEAPDGKTS